MGGANEGPSTRTRVMIVDDDPDIRMILGAVLDRDDLDIVAVAPEGKAAVRMAMEYQPDIVVLDFMMPEIDGAETARFLRAVSPDAHIIAFSGAIHELPEWADDFLCKGGIAEIESLINKVVGDVEVKPVPQDLSEKPTRLQRAQGMLKWF